MAELTLLDVGHGNASVVQGKDGTVLIDTGLGGTVIDFLAQQGITQLTAVFLSHADQDHIGGLVGLLSSGQARVQRVRLNTDSLKRSKIWDDLLFELQAQSNAGQLDFAPLLVAERDDISLGDCEAKVLAPGTYLAGKGPGSTTRDGRAISTNAISAIIAVRANGETVALLPGDIDEIGLEDVVSRGVDLHADVLVFPHHGGHPGSGEAREFAERLIDLVRPTNVVFSFARDRFGMPVPDIIDAIRRRLPECYISCTQLSRHCAADTPAAAPAHLLPIVAAGREKRHCCAGSMIKMLSPFGHHPTPPMHMQFVNAAAPTALCRRKLN